VIRRPTQGVVDDAGGRRECIADLGHPYADGLALYHSIRKASLLVEVQSFNPKFPRGARTEAAHLSGTVHADGLESQCEPEGVIRRGHWIVSGVLGHGVHTGKMSAPHARAILTV
jgi:hypothetical protein